MANTRARSCQKCTVELLFLSLLVQKNRSLIRIKELELKCSNVDGRLQEREDDYSRK